MSLELKALLDELAHHDTQHDLNGLRSVRERIVANFPKSEAAIEAEYKIGLDLLFRERKLDQAVEKFETAAKSQHPYWAAAARTSLGLCYFHQRRTQKALFELRKVGYTKLPSEHSITALAFMENIFATDGKTEEAKRIRKDRITQLQQLISEMRSDPKRLGVCGHYMYQLGLALHDNQEAQQAHATLQEAAALGAQVLGEDLYRSVVSALKH